MSPLPVAFAKESNHLLIDIHHAIWSYPLSDSDRPSEFPFAMVEGRVFNQPVISVSRLPNSDHALVPGMRQARDGPEQPVRLPAAAT
jgi:hypothetical protein